MWPTRSSPGDLSSVVPPGLGSLPISFLGLLAGVLTWELRALVAVGVGGAAGRGVCGVRGGRCMCTPDFGFHSSCLSLGAIVVTHVCLLTWRVVFEHAEKRRVKSIFSTIVSPKIVNELLAPKSLSLGGARREVTVLFRRCARLYRIHRLQPGAGGGLCAAEEADGGGRGCSTSTSKPARRWSTVNLYLGLVADTALQHDGTLDKFIGDCVMAFWGAPTPNPQHAWPVCGRPLKPNGHRRT